MAKDINSSNIDPKIFQTGFGLLRDIIVYEKKQSDSLEKLIDPLSSLNSLTGNITDIKNELNGIAINVSSLTKAVIDKIYNLGGRDNVFENSRINFSDPIVNSIESLKEDLINKDSVKKTNEESLKALGSTSQDLSKLIQTVSNADPNSGKNLTSVLDSLNSGVQKTNSKKSSISDFASSIGSIGGSLLSFAGTLVLATPLLVLGIPSMLLLGLAMRTLTFSTNEKSVKEIGQGLIWLSLGIASLSLGIYAFGEMASTASVIGAILTVGALGLEMGILGLMSKEIMKGSLAIGLIGISLVALSFGIGVFQSIVSFGGVMAVAGTVLLLGTEFGLAGIFALQIGLGAFAVGLMGIGIASLGWGISTFQQAQIEMDSIWTLAKGIGLLAIEFAGAGLISPLIAVGALSIGTIGLSIAGLSYGLNKVKDIQWNEANTQSLKSAIIGVSSAFMILGSNPIDAVSTMIGIQAISGIGNSMSSLAQGTSDFANMTFTQYEVKDGQIIVKSKTSITDAQIENAGINIGKVLGFVGEPFAKIGKLESGVNSDGSNSGLTMLDYVFAGGFVQMGISSITGIGSSLSSLAQGVQSFANMNFIEYEVKDGKIVPKNVISLTDDMINRSGQNIGRVLSVVGEQFANIGRYNYGSGSDGSLLGSIFGGGQNLVKAGTSIISGLGSNLISLADSVIKFANMEFVEHQIINGKLVPVRVVSIKQPELDRATSNIVSVLGVVANAYSTIGKMENDSTGFFSDGNLKKGTELMRGLGGDLSQMTDVIIKLSAGSVPVFDSNGKIVSTVPINSDIITKAGNSVFNILSVIGNSMNSFGQNYNSSSENFLKSKSGLDSAKILISSYVDIQNIISKIPQETKIQDFKTFSGLDLNKLAWNSEGLVKAGEGSLKIGQGLKMMTDSINSMDLKKLTLTDSMFNSLAHLSKINGGFDRLGSELKESIETSFGQLVQFLKELSGENMQSSNLQSSHVESLINKINPIIQSNTQNLQPTVQQNPINQIPANMQLNNELLINLNSILKEIQTLLMMKKF